MNTDEKGFWRIGLLKEKQRITQHQPQKSVFIRVHRWLIFPSVNGYVLSLQSGKILPSFVSFCDFRGHSASLG